MFSDPGNVNLSFYSIIHLRLIRSGFTLLLLLLRSPSQSNCPPLLPVGEGRSDRPSASFPELSPTAAAAEREPGEGFQKAARKEMGRSFHLIICEENQGQVHTTAWWDQGSRKPIRSDYLGTTWLSSGLGNDELSVATALLQLVPMLAV